MKQIIKAKINKHYNKFVIIFIIFAVIIVLFTGYFAFAKTIITIVPAPKVVKSELTVPAADIDAKFANKDLTDTLDYQVSSTATISEDGYATGKITIYNDYVSDQQLVATTRLLSKDGVLFRTQNDVIVPKGSSLEVDVKADQPGKTGDIAATDFEIVALNSAKKSKIYGKSTTNMTGGVVASTIITEEDITKAKNVAADTILDKAFNEFSQEYPDITKQQISMELTKQETANVNGQKTNNISINTSATFKLAQINTDKLKKLCTEKLSEKYSDNYNIAIAEDLKYTVSSEGDVQNIKTNCSGTALLIAHNNIIDKNSLTNKTINQVKKYLEGFEDVQSAEIKISPFWVKTTPFIKENIIIELK